MNGGHPGANSLGVPWAIQSANSVRYSSQMDQESIVPACIETQERSHKIAIERPTLVPPRTSPRYASLVVSHPPSRPSQFVIQVEAVILQQGQAVLLQDPDGLWSLPGGALTATEQPSDALRNTVRSLLGWNVQVMRVLGCLISTSEELVNTEMADVPVNGTLTIVYGCIFDSDWPPKLNEGWSLSRFWNHDLSSIPLSSDRVELLEAWLNEAG